MKVLKLIIFIIFSIFYTNIAKAQIDSSEVIRIYSKKLAFSEDFSGAIIMYKNLLDLYPDNPVMYFKLGYAYLNTMGKTDSAIYFFKKSNQLYEDKYYSEINPVEIKFYLARAYAFNKQYDSSLVILEKMRMNYDNPFLIKILSEEINSIKQTYTNIKKVYKLDSIINTSYTEHSPVYIPELKEMIFTSRRPHAKGTILDDSQYDEEILYSVWQNNHWTEPKPIDLINSEYNDAISSVIPGSYNLLLYKDDNDGDIYQSYYLKGKWTTPKPLPSPINSRHRETSASITKDGKQIFFTSDRPGGYGGLDIWTSRKISDGSWSKPENLGDAVNTKGNEEGVFISADGNTIYFSSDGMKGFGGYDIYVSYKNQFGTWAKAINLGYPINSVGDDIFFTPDDNNTTAYFSSYRYGSKGADIFVVLLRKFKHSSPIINYGFLLDENKKPVTSNIKIEIKDGSNNLVAISRPNKKGKFVFLTYPVSQYHIIIYRESKVVFEESFVSKNYDNQVVFYKNIQINSNVEKNR